MHVVDVEGRWLTAICICDRRMKKLSRVTFPETRPSDIDSLIKFSHADRPQYRREQTPAVFTCARPRVSVIFPEVQRKSIFTSSAGRALCCLIYFATYKVSAPSPESD